MFNYLFGPVRSRRLGVSLGIDLVPYKTCSYNCIYCECGRTTDVTVQRQEYVPLEIVESEIVEYLENNSPPDFMTFSGSGEPTLHRHIGQVIRFIKQRAPDIKVAVLTNGSLLFDPAVRCDINDADVVMPSLDAVSIDVFHKINRPHSSLELKEIIHGLEKFRQEFDGLIWLEVFFILGLNTHQTELERFREVIKRIKPDRIQLNSLDRPGTEKDVEPVSLEILTHIMDYWRFPECEIIASPAALPVQHCDNVDIKEKIINTISRRPCTIEDLSHMLHENTEQINAALKELEFDGEIKKQSAPRGVFYSTH